MSWGITPAAHIIQTATGTYATYTSFDGSTAANQIPADDTIPQNTEGTELITVAITPKFSSSKMRITVSGFGTMNGAGGMMAALFRDSTANAIYATETDVDSSNFRRTVAFEHIIDASSTSATTLKLRVGPNNTQIMYVNGTTTARLFGGVATWRMTVEELRA